MQAAQFYRYVTGITGGLYAVPPAPANSDTRCNRRDTPHDVAGTLCTARAAYYMAALFVLGLAALAAVAYGFLTVDSWNYLHLAQALREGQGCSVDGAYFAIFPCGYPLAIALLAPSHDIASLIVSSKATNLVLAFGGFWLLTKTFRHPLVPALVMLNPLTLGLYQYTWSENLSLFAFCGALFALDRIHGSAARYGKAALLVGLLAVFLIIGCSSRYFFAPFAAAMFVGVWLAYGRRTALISLPAFVVAALFFVGYQKFNVEMTGFGTGIERIPAPETFGFLLLKFLLQLAKESAWFALAGALLLWLARRHWTPLTRVTAVAGYSGGDARACRLLFYSGLGFLLLAFYLRTKTQYDLYSPRTVSYGLTFVAAATIGLVTRIEPRRGWPALPVALYGIVALAVSQDLLLPFQIKDSLKNGYVYAPQLLDRYHSKATDADAIVSLQVPDLTRMVDGFGSLYYPKGATIVEIYAAPYRVRDTLNDLKERIGGLHARSCVIDFTPFHSRAQLQDYVDQTYPVEFSFASLLHVPGTIQRPDFDPSVKDYLLRVFRPGQFVPCTA
ncbi:MAG TPA: hypothetical protein VNE00_03310 [Paraburkholderia sp.]|jgi:hypothetical protein|nr:hypothetical protein [Paraburkholderia sp.]